MSESDVSSLLHYWLRSLDMNLNRYVVFSIATWLLLWYVLKVPLKHRKIRPDSPPARQLLLEFVISLRTVVVFATVNMITFALLYFGHLPGPGIAAQWGPVWFWVSFALMLLAHDTWFYWTHRAMHRMRAIRRFHWRHHKSNNPSPFAAYSTDVGEAVINSLFIPVWLALVPTDWGVLVVFTFHQIIRNTVGHAGYELMPATRDGKPLIPWLTSITHHDLHHGQANWNYGLYFTWWDRLMGTEHPQYLDRFAAATGRASAPGVSVAGRAASQA